MKKPRRIAERFLEEDDLEARECSALEQLVENDEGFASLTFVRYVVSQKPELAELLAEIEKAR